MPEMFDRALPLTGRAFTRAVAAGSGTPPTVAASSLGAGLPSPAHQGRGSAQLALADRILRQAAASGVVTREDVTPDLEPLSPSLTDEEPGEDFTDNEDVTDELEPFDPSIESQFRATVTGDENSVTITADEDEDIVAVLEEDNGDLEVLIEDSDDVLLAAPPAKQRVIVEGDDQEITITAEEGETLYIDEADGAVIVEVEEDAP